MRLFAVPTAAHRRPTGFWIVPVAMLFVVASCASPADTPTPTADQISAETPTAAATDVEETPPAAASVTVGYFPTIAHIAPIFVSEGVGCFEEQNLEVEPVEFARANLAIPALITGEVDALLGVSVGGALYNPAATQPGSVKLVGALITVDEGSLIGGYTRKDLYDAGEITSAEDLAGRTVTLPGRGSAPEYALHVALSEVGLSLDDVEVQTLPSYQEIEQALRSGTIEFGILGEPFATNVRDDDVAVPITPYGEYLAGSQLTYTAYGRRLLEEEREVGQRLMDALLCGVEEYERARTGGDNRDEVVGYLQNGLPGTEASVIDAAPWYYLQPDGVVNVEELADAANYFIEQGYIEHDLPPEEVVDTGFTGD